MSRFSWNTVQISVPTGANRVQALGGNPSRVSLVVSSPGTGGITLANLGGSGADGVWAVLGAVIFSPIRYRDVGPLMQDAIYVSHSSGSTQTIIVTEIYKLPGC